MPVCSMNPSVTLLSASLVDLISFDNIPVGASISILMLCHLPALMRMHIHAHAQLVYA